MLCDDWLAFRRRTARRTGDRDDVRQAESLCEMLGEATRLVIAPDAVAMLDEINATTTAESFDAARAYCVAPAHRTWIEWFCPKRRTRVGFLLEGEASDRPAVRGRASIVVATKTIRGDRVPTDLFFAWDMPNPGRAMTICPESAKALPTLQTMLPDLNEEFAEDLVQTLVTALALIASSRLSRITPVDLAALNKKRRRLGREEFLSHSEIGLTLAPQDAAASCSQRLRQGVPPCPCALSVQTRAYRTRASSHARRQTVW